MSQSPAVAKKKFAKFNQVLLTITYIAVMTALWHESGQHWAVGLAYAFLIPMLFRIMSAGRDVGVAWSMHIGRIIIATTFWTVLILNITVVAATSLFSPGSIVMYVSSIFFFFKGIAYYREAKNARGHLE